MSGRDENGAQEAARALAAEVGAELARADRELMELLGIELVEIQPGRVVCTMKVREEMANSHGVCHGGLIYALADHAFGYACMSSNRRGVTLSGQIIYNLPARVGHTLTATARISSDGLQTASCGVEVTDPRGEVVAEFQGVYYRMNRSVLPPE